MGMIDTATLGFSNETMEGAIADLGPYLRHVHVGDGRPNGHLALGEGELDLPHMMNELDKAAYPYYLSLEILNNLYTRNPRTVRNTHGNETSQDRKHHSKRLLSYGFKVSGQRRILTKVSRGQKIPWPQCKSAV